MGLKRTLNSNWFIRLVLISWIVCGVCIYVVFKNMELIVHGQLYYYGLVFSADWADPYRVLTWMIFICLGVPMALSGVALVSSFLKVEEVPKRKSVVPQSVAPKRGAINAPSPQIAKEVPVRVESSNGLSNGGGISCPNCKRSFGRALVMLDFRGGKNRMVSVCPYCNSFLGYTSEEKASSESFHVAASEEKIVP
jgi:hypothetical protein